MAKTIAIVNQKGGVGKTTTCVNLAAALKEEGARVLVCDFDPQANATSGFGVDKTTVSPNIYDVLINGADVKRAVVETPYGDVLHTLNSLSAADTIMVPVQCEYYALEGLSDLLSTIRIVKRSLNPAIELEGVVLTMYDGRTNLSMQVAEEVKRHFPGQVYATVIPRNVRLAEAPSYGKPVSAYDSLSRGAEAYQELAREVMEKNKG